MTIERRVAKKLDEGALDAYGTPPVDRPIDKDQAVIDAASEGPWIVATSCSWRRIVHEHHSTPIITPVTQQSDGHPDLDARPADLEFVARARTGWPKDRARADRLQGENQELRRQLEQLQQEREKPSSCQCGVCSCAKPGPNE